jgi:hypothetical protein
MAVPVSLRPLLSCRVNTAANTWADKTRLTIDVVFKLLVEVFGEKADMAAFKYATLADFRDIIVLKLPANRDKIRRFKGKTARQIVAMRDVRPMSVACGQLLHGNLFSCFGVGRRQAPYEWGFPLRPYAPSTLAKTPQISWYGLCAWSLVASIRSLKFE